ncbi:MAG: phage Gp37/Gp68 family protein [Verrucomicrobiota bacterium]|nr:DUF5131 family protein [Chthoniobacterales bacterium]MDQ3415108.1 phage Gp37/Gp68 family protein [Verrucomicrobiota bacterium]
MEIEWVREIFRACRKQKVPFFFKQWGVVRKDLTGRLLGGALTTRAESGITKRLNCDLRRPMLRHWR